MKILIVSHSDIAGGAGRAAYRLHTGFQDRGVDSSMIVRRKVSADPAVRCAKSRLARLAERIRARAEDRAQRLREFQGADFVSLNLLPTRWSRDINQFGADVVNLHWFGSGALSIRDLSRIRRPVVMTLHDMWGFGGAEHFTDDGENAWWRAGDENLPDKNQGPGRGLSRQVWLAKRRHWKPVPVICPSRWLAENARASKIMRGWPIHVVPNVLDTGVFKPSDKEQSRENLGFPTEQRIVLFGAAGGASDPRKGFDLLVEALERLNEDGEEFLGVVFGQEKPNRNSIRGVPLRWMGVVDDDNLLAQLYCAADVMVVPSRQESFGQTASEAHACGTPVVAFDATGLPDIVVHEETGYLAEPFSAQDLASGILWVLEDRERLDALGRSARARAVERWHASVVIPQYERVFRDALRNPS